MTVLGLSQGDTKGGGGRRRRKAETREREEGRLAGASDTHEGEDEGEAGDIDDKTASAFLSLSRSFCQPRFVKFVDTDVTR